MQQNKYTSYKAIDYLKDDDFLRWQLFQSKEDDLYWENILVNNPELEYCIKEAQELYSKNIQLSNHKMSQEEVISEFISLHDRIKRKKRARHTILWIASTACFLLLSISLLFKFIPLGDPSSTLAVADGNKIYNSNEIILTVGDSDIMLTNDSEIQYLVDGDITVDGEKLDKHNTQSGSSAIISNKLVVPHGRSSKIRLSDNSVIWVNAGTTLMYPSVFEKNKREIYVNGEVFIDATTDKDRPFIVKTNNLDVQVLGTKFNIIAYESDAMEQVILASGSVKVTSQNNKDFILKPSQMYQYENGIPSVQNVDLRKYISWIDGIYYFEDERLDRIMNKLSRYYGVDIICSQEIKHEKCSGKMMLKNDLKDILNGLSFSFPIEVEEIEGIYYVK